MAIAKSLEPASREEGRVGGRRGGCRSRELLLPAAFALMPGEEVPGDSIRPPLSLCLQARFCWLNPTFSPPQECLPWLRKPGESRQKLRRGRGSRRFDKASPRFVSSRGRGSR